VSSPHGFFQLDGPTSAKGRGYMNKSKGTKKKIPTAEELEEHFDAGGDVTDHADTSRASIKKPCSD